MSCWVVPSVAADLWGCAVQAVMDAIRAGEVATRDENGWTFVDVAPDSPQLLPQAIGPSRPAAFDAISGAELAALTGPIEDYQVALEIAEDNQDVMVKEPDMVGDWREVRSITPRLFLTSVNFGRSASGVRLGGGV